MKIYVNNHKNITIKVLRLVTGRTKVTSKHWDT